jgi:hypothetical protein
MSVASSAMTLDQGQILFYETMAALLRAKEAVRRQVGFWGILNGLWKVSREMKALSANLKAGSELPDGVMSDQIIQSQIPQLRKLVASTEELIDTARQHQLLNRSLTSAPLRLIMGHGEYVADYLESLEMSVDPEVLAAIQEGREQIERGEYEIADRLF